MNSADVIQASGLTYRQLDHACRQEWLKPDNPHGKGTDNGRQWSYEEYQIAIIAGRLMRAGFKTKNAMQLARSSMNRENETKASPGLVRIYLGHGVTIELAK